MATQRSAAWRWGWWRLIAVRCVIAGAVLQLLVAWSLCWRTSDATLLRTLGTKWDQTQFNYDSSPYLGKVVAAWEPRPVPSEEPLREERWSFEYVNGDPPRWSWLLDRDETLRAATEQRNASVSRGFAGYRIEVAAGWPWLSHRCLFRGHDEAWVRGIPPNWRLYGAIAGIAETATSHGPCRALPVIPIWRGLAGNTLVYGLVVFGCVIGFTARRRASRFRRGLCPVCGYELGFDLSTGCPECGWRRRG